MHHYTTVRCTKFQGNQITCFHFMVTLKPLQKEEKKAKKLSQCLKVHISEMPDAIYLKFGMWGTGGGGHIQSRNCPVSYKQHRVTYTRKSHFCSSCQYAHGCGAPACWAAWHTTMCLIPIDSVSQKRRKSSLKSLLPHCSLRLWYTLRYYKPVCVIFMILGILFCLFHYNQICTQS